MLRAKEKERRSSIVYGTKREKAAGLYRGKRSYSASPSITTGVHCRESLPRLGLLLGMGAGSGPWGLQATGLMPAAFWPMRAVSP